MDRRFATPFIQRLMKWTNLKNQKLIDYFIICLIFIKYVQ